MDKKYRICHESWRLYRGITVRRIQAVRDFADVRAGDIGGFVSSEANLSHEGECWLYGDSKAIEDARVTENAMLFDSAVARNAAEIKEHARITCEAIVEDYSTVRGSAHVGGGAVVRWSSTVSGNAKVYGHAVVTSAHICEKAEVYDSARITKSVIQGEAKVFGDGDVINGAVVGGLEEIGPGMHVDGGSPFHEGVDTSRPMWPQRDLPVYDVPEEEEAKGLSTIPSRRVAVKKVIFDSSRYWDADWGEREEIVPSYWLVRIDHDEHKIEFENLGGYAPNAKSVFDFLLHDRDVRQELRWARDEYRRKYPVYLEEREGMSGCWDVRLCYTKYRPKHGWAEEFHPGGVPVLQWHESCAGKMNKGIPDVFSGDLYEFMCYCMSATPAIQDSPEDIRNAWHTHKWVSRPSEADEKFCNFVSSLDHPRYSRGARLYRYGKLRPRRKPEYFTFGCYRGGEEE